MQTEQRLFNLRTTPHDREVFSKLKEYHGHSMAEIIRMLAHAEARRIEEQQRRATQREVKQ